MRVGIFGMGYVGFTAACCIARSGHDVLGVDVNGKKVAQIMGGQAPIEEPGVQDLLEQALAASRLEAVTTLGPGMLDDVDVAIVCVGTPSSADGSHDMGHIAEVTRQVAQCLPGRSRPLTIVYRSTIRPGTVEELILPILRSGTSDGGLSGTEVVYNPEFLREGSAVNDYFNPPKIVVGTHDGMPNAALEALHGGIDAPTFVVGYREAELTKFVDNSWHAVKVAFANEIGRVCLQLGISAATIHELFVADTTLNISATYTRPGGAFGGSCLPKDVRALQHIAADCGANTHVVDSLLRSNEAHKHALFEYVTEDLEPDARVLLVGLAFKAGTDDLRESPNVDLARKLLGNGYRLDIHDPGIDATKLMGANLGYAYTQLPELERLLVDEETTRSRTYDRVVTTNATAARLEFRGDHVIDLERLP